MIKTKEHLLPNDHKECLIHAARTVAEQLGYRTFGDSPYLYQDKLLRIEMDQNKYVAVTDIDGLVILSDLSFFKKIYVCGEWESHLLQGLLPKALEKKMKKNYCETKHYFKKLELF